MENEVKEPALKYGYISPDEYFEMEEEIDERLEYYDGFVAALGTVSVSHGRISTNLITGVGSFLKDKPCELLPAQIKVCAPSRNTYVYPDATIFCTRPEFQDEKRGTILNPSVAFEILSKSTEKNDLTYKFLFYQTIASLREYIMIDSRSRYVKVARREGRNLWSFEDLLQPDAVLNIQTIDFRISFDDIYRNTGL